MSDCQTTNRDGGDELSDARPGLVPRFGEVAGDLLVDLRRRKRVGSECGEVLPGDDDNHGDNGDDKDDD